MKRRWVLAILALHGAESWANAPKSPYADQIQNTIKAIPKADLEGLRAGHGTPFGGMAKAAELNGLPGPRHVLDLGIELKLSRATIAKVQSIFDRMQARAKVLGKELIAAEREIDRRLKGKALTAKDLRTLVNSSAQKYGELRYVHLAAHLETSAVLSKEEIAAYIKFRGYGSGDPCKSVPAGHPVEMWKKHHGCGD